MSSKQAVVSRLHILHSHVRRNLRGLRRYMDQSRAMVTPLHTEAGLAAATCIKAGSSSSQDFQFATLAFGSMIALSSLAMSDSKKGTAEVIVAESQQEEQKHDATQPRTTSNAHAASNSLPLPNPNNPLSTACEPIRTPSKPRNAMITSRKSLRGRGLYDKYKVDWDTVLGEGAYGTVHPARLAATGEKVNCMKTCAITIRLGRHLIHAPL